MLHCSCGGRILQITNYSNVCTECGTEKRFLTNELPGYTQSHSRFQPKTTYCRIYRFRVLLSRTVLYSSLNFENPVWEFLKKKKYTSPDEIRKQLSQMKHLKNKLYDSLPLFCYCFLNTHPTKVTHEEFQLGMRLFTSLNARWEKSDYTRFFSYFWILEKILEKIGALEFIPITKKLICRKRREYYSQMLATLGGLHK
jgi:hypothetical protein